MCTKAGADAFRKNKFNKLTSEKQLHKNFRNPGGLEPPSSQIVKFERSFQFELIGSSHFTQPATSSARN